MKQIRNNIFETNSSSIHSVSIRGCNKNEYTEPDEEEIKYSLNYDESDNYLHACLGEFGWEIESYDMPCEKLSYLLTMICATSGIDTWWGDKKEDELREELSENECFKELNEKLIELSGTNGIYVDDMEGYIDHQSSENYSDAKEFLANKGFNPLYGARPLKRTIRQYVENPLAKAIIENKFIVHDNIVIDVQDDKIVFEKK